MNPSAREVKNAAKDQGIMDMSQDGIIKALRGQTSIEEVERVVNFEKREVHATTPSEENNFQELTNDDLLEKDLKL